MKELRHKAVITWHLQKALSYFKEQSGWDVETQQLERLLTSLITKTEGKQ